MLAVAFLALGSATVPVADAVAAKRIFGKRALHQGMRGRDVRVLQDFLTRAGFTHDGRRPVRLAARLGACATWERQESAASTAACQPPRRQGAAHHRRVELRRAPAARRPGRPARPSSAPDGLAVAPADAPPQVQAIIEAGNRIATKPYKYGGGHGKWEDTGYDCSGSMSYAFHGAGMLDEALDSSGFMSWGEAGKGTWVTIYAKGSHAYMIVAGLRFDTSGRANQGTRWQADMRSTSGYTVRHPEGL